RFTYLFGRWLFARREQLLQRAARFVRVHHDSILLRAIRMRHRACRSIRQIAYIAAFDVQAFAIADEPCAKLNVVGAKVANKRQDKEEPKCAEGRAKSHGSVPRLLYEQTTREPRGGGLDYTTSLRSYFAGTGEAKAIDVNPCVCACWLAPQGPR